jgi:deoxyribodipyrimidine photo-lyase
MSKHARPSSSREPSDPALKHPPTKRAREIDAQPPFHTLAELLEGRASSDAASPRNVLHWFRSKDLRAEDNRGLHAAGQKAQEGKGHLITMYLHSPKDLEWHGTSPARTDFILENLRILKEQLAEENIPLAVIEAPERKDKVDKVLELVEKYDVSHVFANMEYEVDELRRDIKFAKELKEDVSLEILHDQTVVVPGELKTGAGGPHKVFTPYHKAWLAETASDPALYDTVPAPKGNSKDAQKDLKALFETAIPSLPPAKTFASDEERDRLRRLWPAGHKAGIDRLQHFLDEKVRDYAAYRSQPARDLGSRLSPYFASGALSVREALQACKKSNDNDSRFDAGDAGIAAWVRELVFREFYRHTMVSTPHDSLNLPHNLNFDKVHWEADESGWEKWCAGTTGVPFVDAGMRQLRAEAYMHNRLRMNVSSYLSGNLLIDYRRGERFFAEHLVDWDLCNNTMGWEPSYTIFNPVSQAERNDPDGEYIRKWVPELRDVPGKAVFAPWKVRFSSFFSFPFSFFYSLYSFPLFLFFLSSSFLFPPFGLIKLLDGDLDSNGLTDLFLFTASLQGGIREIGLPQTPCRL